MSFDKYLRACLSRPLLEGGKIPYCFGHSPNDC